jgi:hypothetical protein
MEHEWFAGYFEYCLTFAHGVIRILEYDLLEERFAARMKPRMVASFLFH